VSIKRFLTILFSSSKAHRSPQQMPVQDRKEYERQMEIEKNRPKYFGPGVG